MADKEIMERFDAVEWSWRAKRKVGREIGLDKLSEDDLERTAALFGGKVVRPPVDLRKAPRESAWAGRGQAAPSQDRR